MGEAEQDHALHDSCSRVVFLVRSLDLGPQGLLVIERLDGVNQVEEGKGVGALGGGCGVVNRGRPLTGSSILLEFGQEGPVPRLNLQVGAEVGRPRLDSLELRVGDHLDDTLDRCQVLLHDTVCHDRYYARGGPTSTSTSKIPIVSITACLYPSSFAESSTAL